MSEMQGPIQEQKRTEQVASTKPEFDGGSFTISRFSPSPHGFEVQTRSALGRTEGVASNTALDVNARAMLKAAMQGEMKFSNVQAVKDARDAWLHSTESEEEAAELENNFYDERKKYQAKGKKLGIRNISVEGNTVTADVKLVSFPVYNQFARPEDSQELIDLSANAAGAMIVRSADGRLVIQHRAVSKQN
ncbi:MAG: hypothetical protein H0W89_03900 [Candidatus Levybacteria bacterium]|nr:hypothetical protein [Candidatus Levybacteria bacterium]